MTGSGHTCTDSVTTGCASIELSDATANMRPTWRRSRPFGMSEAQLLERAKALSAAMEWDRLHSGAWRWKWKSSIDDFSVYTRQEGNLFAVLASGPIQCSAAELQALFSSQNDEEYTTTMRDLFGYDFLHGVVSYGTNSQRSMGQTKKNRPMDDLRIKTATFARPHLLACNEHWCYMEYIERDREAGTLRVSMKSIGPGDLKSQTSKQTPALHEMTDVVAGYYVHPNPNGKGVHLYFYAQTPVQTKRGRSLRQVVSSNTMKDRILSMAQASCRLPRMIRRRRLSTQVLAARSCPTPSSTSCTCCSREWSILTRKKQCRLCAQPVCQRCSDVERIERRHAHRFRSHRVRICQRCIDACNACEYTTQANQETPWQRQEESRHVDTAEEDHALNILLQDGLVNANALGSTTAQLISQIHERSTRERGSDRPLEALIQRLGCREQAQAKRRTTAPRERSRAYALAFSEDCDSPPSPIGWTGSKPSINPVLLDVYTDDLMSVCRIASRLTRCKLAFISMVSDMGTITIHASNVPEVNGLNFAPSHAMCTHVIMAQEPLVVPHPEADVRFCHQQMRQTLNARFYIGVPIRASNNDILGVLTCIHDHPQRLTTAHFNALTLLARVVSKMFASEVF